MLKFYVYYSCDACGEEIHGSEIFSNERDLLKHRNRTDIEFITYQVIKGVEIEFTAVETVTQYQIKTKYEI